MEEVFAFLQDERFKKLRLLADTSILLRSDLENFEMPDGCSRDDVWTALQIMRRQTASVIDDVPYGKVGVECWYSMNTAMSRIATELDLRVRADYPLDRGLKTFGKSPFIAKNLVKNLQYAFAAEGLTVSERRIQEIWDGASFSDDDVFARIIANYFEIKEEEEILARREITPGFIELLHYRLVDGIDPDKLPKRTSEAPAVQRGIPKKPDYCLEAVCKMADRAKARPFQSMLMRMVYINWVFFDFEVFPHLSALVGALLRDMIAIKWDAPVVKWVPLRYPPTTDARVEEVHNTCWVDTGMGLDFTNIFLVYLEAYHAEIDVLEARVRQLEKLDELIENTFSFPMNKRQVFIMSTICKDPYARMRIEPHRKLHGVAYSTARKDFFDLEKAGYLVCEQEDKAFVFIANPELRDRIVSLNEKAIELLGGSARS